MPDNNPRNNAQTRAVTRNLVAKHQWQRGGVHEKPYKAKRQQAKQALKREIRAGKNSSSDFFMGLNRRNYWHRYKAYLREILLCEIPVCKREDIWYLCSCVGRLSCFITF